VFHIISGWSNPGGSTTAFINLTNALNNVGIETKFWGLHKYHLNKCNSEIIYHNKLNFNKNDTAAVHYIKIKERLPVRKMILSSHEQNMFPIKNISYKLYDKIHYVSEHQRQYHNVDHPYFICGNILDNLKINPKPTEKIGAVIGSIDANKQVHVSINRALNDGCEKVFVFGKITDPVYYNTFVKILIDNKKIIRIDFENDKQKMYDSVTDVYQDSIMETWGYVKAECIATGTNFHGSSATDGLIIQPNQEILDVWAEEIFS
jgi:hypothetical protein